MAVTRIPSTGVNSSQSFTFANVTTSGNVNTSNLTANTQVTVTGNVDFQGPNVSLGNISNLHITGGINGYVLQTDGSGSLSWVAQSGGGGGSGTPGGSNTQIQYNNSGNFGGSSTFTFNSATNAVNITGNVTSGNAKLGNLAVANYFSGNGILLSSITGANVTGFVPNANVANTAYAVSGANVTGQVANAATAGTVYGPSQPNITAIGTLTSLNVSGNVTSGYFVGNGYYLTGIAGGSTYSNSNVASYLPTYTGAFTAANITTTGNISGAYILGNGSQLTGLTASQLAGAYSNTNVASYLPTYTGNITAGNVNVTSNVSGAYILGNGSQLTGIANANYAAYAGNITIASQPNITSVGTLASLTVTANISSGNANLGNVVVSNYFVGNGYYLTGISGGTSTYSNANVANYLPTYTGAFTAANITSTGNISGSFILGNGSQLTGISSSQITGAYSNTNVASYLPTYTGAFTAANITTTGNISGSYLLGNGSQLTGLTNSQIAGAYSNTNAAGYLPTYTGNITAGNINATSNVSGAYIVGNGSALTGITATQITGAYSNTNVAAYLPTYTGNILAGNGNITGQLVVGGNLTTGGNLTIANGTANLNVANLVVTGNITSGGNLYIASGNANLDVGNLLVSGNISSTGNANLGVGNLVTGTGSGGTISGANLVSANYYQGNGYLLTGISASQIAGGYANSNVASYLPTYTGAITAGNLTTTGNVVGGNLVTTGQANIGNLYVSGNVLGNLIPNANIQYDLGTSTKRWRDLYLSGTTIYLGSTTITTSSGSLSTPGNFAVTSGNFSVSGDSVLTGNLTVTGTTTYINVTSFETQDPIIGLGGGVNAAPLTTNDGKDRGTLLHYYTTSAVDAFMGWDNSNSEFGFGSNVNTSSDVVTWNSYGNIRAGNFIGTGSQLTGNITAGNLTTTGNVGASYVNANYLSGNGSLLTSLTGGNVTGQVGNSLIAGTVYTNAQPNITSVGTLTSLTVSGNASASLLLGNGYYLTGISSGVSTYSNSNVASYLPTYTGNILAGNVSATGNVSASYVLGNGSQLTGLPATYSNTNVASYLPTYTGNLTAGNVTATGNISGSYILGNGSALTGVIAATATSATTAATVTTNAQPNITSVGSLASLTVTGLITATGTGIKLSNIQDSAGTVALSISSGNLSVYNNIIAGSSGSGNVTATYFVGNGSALTGVTAATATTAATVTTNAQPNITSLGTLASLTVTANTTSGNLITGGVVNATGNISGNYHIGNGSTLSSLTGGNVTGQVGNALIAGTVYTNAQPNITSVGTLASLTVTANTTSGNLITGGVVTATGNVSGNYILGNGSALTGITATVAQTVSTNAQPNITSLGTLASLTVTANTTSGNLITGGVVNATGNISGNYHIGNGATLSSLTGGNVTGQVGNALIAGTVYTNAQPNITSVGTLSSLVVTANANVGNLNATGKVYANDNMIIGSTGGEGGQLVVGWVGINNIFGQANGTWNLDVDSSNNFRIFSQNATGTASSPVNFYSNGNVSASYWLGNGSALTGVTATASLPITSGTSNINIASSGGNVTLSVGGTANVAVFSTSAMTLVANGNITMSGTGSQLSGANLVSATNLTGTLTTNAQPNITSVGTLTTLSSGTHTLSTNSNVTLSGTASQVSGANLISGTYITGTLTTNAQPNITSVGTLASLTVTANTTSGNLITGGVVTATGNVSGNYILGNGSALTSITATTAVTVTANAQPNITSLGTINGLTMGATTSVSGANLVSATYLAGTLTTASAAQGNITSLGTLASITLGANNNVTMSGTASQLTGANLVSGTYLAGTLTTASAAQGNITAVGTLASLTVTANTTSGNLVTPGALVSTVATGTAPLTITSTTRVNNLNVNYANVSDYNVVTAQTTGTAYLPLISGATTGNYAFNANATFTANIANGVITATGFKGDGSQLTSIPVGTSLANGTSNVAIPTSAGNVTVSVGGTVNVAVFSTTALTMIANGNIAMSGSLSQIAGGNLISATYLTGTLTTAAQPNITSIGTLAAFTSGTHTISTNANIAMSGTASQLTGANLVSGTYLAGTLTTASAAQGNITAVGTLASLTVTANTTSGNLVTPGALVSTVATGTAPLTVTSTTRVNNLNVAYANVSDFGVVTTQTTGTFYPVFVNGSTTANYAKGSNTNLSFNAATGALTSTLFTGTLTTNAQPNITSVGTLASLTVTANTTSGNLVTGGALVSTVATGTAPLTVTSTTRVNNLNVNYANVSDFGVVTTQTTGTFYPVFVNGSTTGNYAKASNTAFSFNAATGTLTATAFSGNGAALTGLPSSGATISDDNSTNTSEYVVFARATTGTLSTAYTSSTKATYNPSTGTMSAVIFTSTSDEKLKANIKTIENPLNKVKQLRGVSYNWKDTGDRSIGLIAQEVESIVPEVVRQTDNKKTIDYSNMIGLLVEAMKEQQIQIEELQKEIKSLKNDS